MAVPACPVSSESGDIMKAAPEPIRGTAFSLVEVILALGLVSFCLVSIVGLLPVGLKEVKNSRMESAAANALNELANGLRNATNSGGHYGVVRFPSVTWVLGEGERNFGFSLSFAGWPDESDPRMKARIEVMPPSADRTIPGHAHLTVAWPAAATWSKTGWTKSDGSVSASIQFLPKP